MPDNVPSSRLVNNRRAISPIILGVIALLAFASGAYYLGAHNKSNPQQALRPTITDFKVSNTSSPKNDSTSNSKTFNDPTFPFTFQYPYDSEVLVTANVATAATLIYQKSGPSSGYMNLGFDFTKTDKSIKEYADDHIEKSKSNKYNILVPLKEISINDLVVLTYIAQEAQGFGYTIRFIFIKSDDTNYIVSFSEIIVAENASGFKETTDQILSTFKFSQKKGNKP